jgi:TolB-like protein
LLNLCPPPEEILEFADSWVKPELWMDSLNPIRTAIKFGEYEFNFAARELRKSGRKIKLQDQPFQILAMLLRAPRALVTREQLRQELWAVDMFVDFEHGLNRAISKLREALGDSASSPRYIETVARHGYRFIAPTEIPQLSSVGRKLRLAVLPCNNLSGGAAEELFSDGMTEELIAQLGQLEPGRLGVIARTSAMQYKGSKKGIEQIGRELHVDYILEGSVRRAADRIRVTAKLIGVADQTHLWAGSYDCDPKNLLAIQSDIASRVRRSLAATLFIAANI